MQFCADTGRYFLTIYFFFVFRFLCAGLFLFLSSSCKGIDILYFISSLLFFIYIFLVVFIFWVSIPFIYTITLKCENFVNCVFLCKCSALRSWCFFMIFLFAFRFVFRDFFIFVFVLSFSWLIFITCSFLFCILCFKNFLRAIIFIYAIITIKCDNFANYAFLCKCRSLYTVGGFSQFLIKAKKSHD